MVYKFVDKKSSLGSITRTDKSAVKSKIMANQHPSDLASVAKVYDRTLKLEEESYKLMIKKIEKRREYSFLKTIFGLLI